MTGVGAGAAPAPGRFGATGGRNRLFASIAAVGLAGLALVAAAQVGAAERVRFEAPPSAGGRATTLTGDLTRPSGAGPFAAVALLHSCLGPPANARAIGERLAAWGYVALFVDEFSTRGLAETCRRDFPEGVADAFAALAVLAARPDVDRARIAVVGFSQGGDVALRIAAAGRGFRAAAAFYPPCDNLRGARLGLPTLIVVGDADAVTPAADCQALAAAQGPGTRLIVPPGAEHGFDDPEFSGGVRRLGMRLAYDRDAAAAGWRALRAFLGEALEHAAIQ